MFGVRTSTITRWAREGKLPFRTTPGGHRRYLRSDIQALLPPDQTGPPEQSELDAVRLYDQGWSVRQVADKFDIGYGVMRRILRKHTTLRGRGGNYQPEERHP